MDTGVATALTAAVGSFATTGLEQLADTLPVAIPVTIAVSLVFMVIRWFRSIAHL